MHDVERETMVAGTPEEAWRAILESDWLGEDVRIDPRPGGEVSPGGFVEEADPPHRLVFWWSDSGDEGSRVEITLDEVDEGTRVRVIESRPLAVLDVYGSDLGYAIGVRGPQALAAA